MEVEKLKKKIEMKEVFEDEIHEELKTIGEKAIEILCKDDVIFNTTSLEKNTIIHKNGLSIDIEADVNFKLLEELNRELKPSKILLHGSGNGGSGLFSSSYPSTHEIKLTLVF